MVITKDKVISSFKGSKTTKYPYLNHKKNSICKKKTSNHSCLHKWAERFIIVPPILNKDKNSMNSRSTKSKNGVVYLII